MLEFSRTILAAIRPPMHPKRPDLLRPSLSPSNRIERAPYSLQVGFLSAFFGGPLAAVGMSMLNSWRMGTLQRDAILLGAMGLLGAGLVGLLAVGSAEGAAWLVTLERWFGRNAGSYLERLGGLLLFAGEAALHRREQRAADLFGLPRPNGWIVGIAFIVGGRAGSLLIDAAVLGGH